MDNIDKVIEAGKITEPHYSLFQLEYLSILILAIVSILILNQFKKGKRQLLLVSAVFLIFTTTMISSSLNDYNASKITYAKEVAIWQDLDAKNYIKGLEKKTKEISYFKISKEQPPQSEFWYGSKSFIHNDILMFATITYNEDETISGWFLINEDLKPNEKPYIEYVELEKDLGNLIDKGFYNVIVHLPSDYLQKKVQK